MQLLASISMDLVTNVFTMEMRVYAGLQCHINSTLLLFQLVYYFRTNHGTYNTIDGNSERGAQASSHLGYLICLRHLFRARAVIKVFFFTEKTSMEVPWNKYKPFFRLLANNVLSYITYCHS